MAYDSDGFDAHAAMKGRNPYRPGTPDADAWGKPSITPVVLAVPVTAEDLDGNGWPVLADQTTQDDLETARAVLEGPLSHRATATSDAAIIDRLRSWRIFGRALKHCPHGNSTGAAAQWRKAHGLARWGVDTCRAAMWLTDNWTMVKLYRWGSANPTEINQACLRGNPTELMKPETTEPQPMKDQPMTRTERMAAIRAELVTLEAEQEQALLNADAVIEAAQKALDKAMAERAALAV